MERILYRELKLWKDQLSRLPLVVRGARQVGKSFLIEQFGSREFQDLKVINFEKQPQLASCFTSLDPKNIIKELQLQAGIDLQPGESLLFLDEIQDCPQALKALRYFAEEMPELHVIAAGSLLEFLLEDKNFSFPVGRVQIMNLGPLTFTEYLTAMDAHPLVDLITNVKSPDQISDGVHQKLLDYVREYICIGGMPGVVSAYLQTKSYLEVKRRQSSILDLYSLDFGKYSTKHAQYRYLKKLFNKLPDLCGKHFKFSKIDPDCANPARDYQEALNRLTQSRLVMQVHFTKGNGLPLRSEKNDKKFKMFFLDVGLLSNSLGLDNIGIDKNLQSDIYRGIIAEQFVAQELNGLQDPFIERGIYFWENTDRSSSAEIDFLLNLSQRMLPVEVKAGSTGRLKSLKQFMNLKKVDLGLRVSEHELALDNNVLSVPFYLLSQINRLVKAYSQK